MECKGSEKSPFLGTYAKIQAEPVPVQRLEDDKFLWKHDTDVYKNYFSLSKTRDQIRCRKVKVN